AFDEVPDEDLVASKTAADVRRVTLLRYLADKVQCVVERIEARDLVDIRAVMARNPRLRYALSKIVSEQHALILAERLLGWTDEALREDLKLYPGVNPDDAIAMR